LDYSVYIRGRLIFLLNEVSVSAARSRRQKRRWTERRLMEFGLMDFSGGGSISVRQARRRA
jgi:hypothetical protein